MSPKPLPASTLDELERLAEAATPGPWTAEYDNDVGPNDEGFWEFYSIRAIRAQFHGEESDARFVAACDPSTILALVREVRELREKVRT